MLPTFIIAGVPKSGTTSTVEYLKSHPQVCMSVVQEPIFFTHVRGNKKRVDGKTPWASGNFDKGLEWYQSLFQACGDAKAIGEASGLYWTAEDAPGLIKQYVPDVKILILLRDPVERMYSHYLHTVRLGHELSPFSEMVTTRDFWFQYFVYVSSYQIHLKRYLKIFSKEHITVFLFDDLKANPQKYMEGMFDVIGVDSDFSLPNIGRKYNPRHDTHIGVLERYLYELSHEIKVRTKRPIPEWLRQIGLSIVRVNSVTVKNAPIPRESCLKLKQEFSETIDFVEDYLGRDLTAWREDCG